MSTAILKKQLVDAIARNDVRAARTCVERGADPAQTLGPENELLLHVAAQHGALDSIGFLLEGEADVNAVSILAGWNKTALHHAAAAGQAAAVGTLLAHGADPFAKTLNGSAPAHLASEHGHLDALRLLVAAMDADGGLSVRDRVSVRQTAIIHDRADIVAYCLDRWPVTDINARDEQGMALMHWAAHNGAANVARLLVRRGADDTQVCGDGRTMRDFADGTPARVVLDECDSLRRSQRLARLYHSRRHKGPRPRI